MFTKCRDALDYVAAPFFFVCVCVPSKSFCLLGVVALSAGAGAASQKMASLMATASQAQLPARSTAPPTATLVRTFVAPPGQGQGSGDAGSLSGMGLGQPVTLVTNQQGVQLIQPVSLGGAVLTQQLPLQSQQSLQQHQQQVLQHHQQQQQQQQQQLHEASRAVLDGWGDAGDVKAQAHLVSCVWGVTGRQRWFGEVEVMWNLGHIWWVVFGV